jgi:DNA invertase Pin-like site-specific DNA recombinase
MYGYARVSTVEQNLDRQIDALIYAGVDPRFIRADKVSGKDFQRPMYELLRQELRSGDTLVIKELDRLGRNYDGIKDEWKSLTDAGVRVKVLDMPILDTNEKIGVDKLITNIVLELLSYIAEQEREKIRSRQAEGIKIAKAKGTHMGRPKAAYPEDWLLYYDRWKAGAIKAVEVFKSMGLSKSTFYKLVRQHESENE